MLFWKVLQFSYGTTFLFGLCSEGKENGKHSFTIIKPSYDIEPPLISATFPNGVQDKLILSHHNFGTSIKDRCNYLGYLENSFTSSVGATGCLNKPGDMMVLTIFSEHSGHHMFSVEFSGKTRILENTLVNKDKVQTHRITRRDLRTKNGDDEIDEDEDTKEAAATTRVRYIPPVVKAVLKFGYDEGLKDVLEKEAKKGFDDWILDVFTHLQAYYRLPSLGTIIEFEIQMPHIYKPGVNWNTCDKGYLTEFEKYDLKDITTKAWIVGKLCGGLAGLGTVGGICNGADVIAWGRPRDVAGTAQTLAHEMGHNFGMGHDSGDCAGIMSTYSGGDVHWSSCSKSEFQHHFALNEWDRGCLIDISGPCDALSCKNGGTCSEISYDGQKELEGAKGFRCDCPENTSGARCEYIDGSCNGERDCCSEKNKCDEGEGNCKDDGHCKEGLKCGYSNCNYRLGKSWSLDDNCCYNPRSCQSQSIERFEPKGSLGTCVFPFTYNSITYNSCAETKKYDDIGWCAWDSVFKEERWGYCTPNCPNVCPRGCQCRPSKDSYKNGGRKVDSQGYCNDWCRFDTCGNRINYWRGIDCGGCNEIRDCPDECAARSGGANDGGKSVVDGYCHYWVNNGWCGVGKIIKKGPNAYAYRGMYKAGIDCRGCIGKDLVCNGQENCCHKDNKCGENEGDCNSDSDCKEGLKCGSNNCAQTKRILNQTSFWDADDDCCYQPSCFKQNPCGELEGDCNTLSDCEVGLVCGSNNCPQGKNFLPEDDCCYKPIGYAPLGCWKDEGERAVPEYQGSPQKDGSIVEGCFEIAKGLGNEIFAIQNGGECWSSKSAIETYNKYGASENCKEGKGGGWANSVYVIKD